ncbi:lysine permease [Saitoella coloradoensis]
MADDKVNVNIDLEQRETDPSLTSSYDPEGLKPLKHAAGKTSEGVQRRLKARHLQMIAIGGTIGTGLFIGIGTAIVNAGPVGALIAYIFIGTVVYSVMQSLGEMATYIPVSGAFTSYATRFISPAFGFSMGWLYWINWAITYAAELTACGLVIQYWTDLNVGIWVGVFWVVLTGSNFLSVEWYGEIEFWVASVKVVTVVGFLILGLILDCGGGDDGAVGFRYWRNPGPFNNYLVESHDVGKFLGFWVTLIQAIFSFQGTELVGVTAGETANPRKNVPKAIRKVFWRILLFYVGTVFFIGLLVPSNDSRLGAGASDASASPFVIAIQRAGIKALPDIINAVILMTVISAGNSNVYAGSRTLLALANVGFAPKILGRTDSRGVPYVAVMATASIGLLAFLNLSNNGITVFNWFVNISALAGLICWGLVNWAHIRFMAALRHRGVSRGSLPFKAMLQPWFAYYGLFWCVLITITQGFSAFWDFDASKFFTSYICLIIFVVWTVSYYIYERPEKGKWLVPLEEMDLDSGRREADEDVWEDDSPKNLWEKFWEFIL